MHFMNTPIDTTRLTRRSEGTTLSGTCSMSMCCARAMSRAARSMR
jgi:hypothetical protein